MNTSKLKSYAPAARRDFIQAVTARANRLGLWEDRLEPMQESGDLVIIQGEMFPRDVAGLRKKLEGRIRREGFQHLMEETAYTWFNRLAALRFMELHNFLGHGLRVLSHPAGGSLPEILEHATDVDLPGLDREQLIGLKLAGNKDGELYSLLLLAQCHALHQAMPFLFERIDDELELLLPDNLLHSQSVLRKLVTQIDESDWERVEIIGWLYQFYISERKEEVIGKVVASEDIPAATQLFTPNWIVKYMVQNSLGRQWLATYPDSPLKAKMEYYIEPAEQTDEVKAQLAAITPASLDPEVLTVLDPACGSGHILVEAYDLLKEIYLERGYRIRDIPRLILEKNLYGLDIDDRAAQLAGFALIMKARGDDRRILRVDEPVKLNVMAIQESGGLDGKRLAAALLRGSEVPELKDAVVRLVELFQHGKTFGSLITVPDDLARTLPELKRVVEEKSASVEDLFAQPAAGELAPFVLQAEILARKYDCVVANPPYMGSKYFIEELKSYLGLMYPTSKQDLYASFLVRNLALCKTTGLVSMITIQNWMFLSSFSGLRAHILSRSCIDTFAHSGRGVWGSDFPTCAFAIRAVAIQNYLGTYKKLFERQGSVSTGDELERRLRENNSYLASSTDFNKIPGSPITYWVSGRVRNLFSRGIALESIASPKQGLATACNDLFLRLWHEVVYTRIGFDISDSLSAEVSRQKWFPYNKGGPYRKWYGNNEYVVNWENDGLLIRNFKDAFGKVRSRPQNTGFYFHEGITWSDITTSNFGARFNEKGFIFDIKGSCAFPEDRNRLPILGLLCSHMIQLFMEFLNPSFTFQVGDLARIPFVEEGLDINLISKTVNAAVGLARIDWDSFETSWHFQTFPMLTQGLKTSSVASSYASWESLCGSNIQRMQELETENNRLFIDAYGLQDELSPEVPEDQITLARADRTADIKRLLSYAVGCMMGRYSLDQPGLVYAYSGNVAFDPEKYRTFPADDDGIVPVTDMEWFSDDAALRFETFLKAAWSPGVLEENMRFVAESLGQRDGETPIDTIRRYFSSEFFKHHLQTYKRRPIYWLFSSGKQRAFECLVYLHRYNEGTLARMRHDYVIPLQGKLAARATYLEGESNRQGIATSERTKLKKQLEVIGKKRLELTAFDEQLRHYADRKIALDLDDGVKVNYGKFGPLLAEVKAVTGGSEE